MLPCLSLLHLLALSCFLSVHHLVKVPNNTHQSWWTFFSQSAIHVCWFGLEAYPAYATLKHTRRVYINPSQSVSAGKPSPDSLDSASLPPPPARTGVSPPAWQVAQSIPTIVFQSETMSNIQAAGRCLARGVALEREAEGGGGGRWDCAGNQQVEMSRWVEMGWDGITWILKWDQIWSDWLRWVLRWNQMSSDWLGWVLRWDEMG